MMSLICKVCYDSLPHIRNEDRLSLVCKVCCDSIPHIRNEDRLRRIKNGMVNVDNYADGVASIHLAAIMEKH